MNNNIFDELLERTNVDYRLQLRDRIVDGMTEEEASLIIKAYDLCDELDNTDSLRNYIPLMDSYTINNIIEELEKEKKIKR